jgi:hypothetical protein
MARALRLLRNRTSLAVLVAAILTALPGPASAQFAVGGRKVAPQETNFAGVRHTSPSYGLVVQINHDVQLNGGAFELSLVDEAYGTLLRQHRTPLVPASLLPVVVVTDAKMARFGEGGRRRMFRWLESDPRNHPDVHVSPAALFISDATLRDQETLRSALTRALSFLFDRRFRESLDSMERPQPDRPH